MSFIYDSVSTPLGRLYLLLKDRKYLAGVSFGRFPGAKAGHAPAALLAELSGYFTGRTREFKCPVEILRGTEFERAVWEALREVPYGQTRTYKWLSERIRRPGACRAVGQALAKNPLMIVLPCHRIIESDGSLGGYTPSIQAKRRLLEMEYYYLQAVAQADPGGRQAAAGLPDGR
jgi:O-6-methylguanine DNA methyltransferase